MSKGYQPGDMYNDLQKKKQPRVKKVDPNINKSNSQLVEIDRAISLKKKVAIMGLV